MDEWRLVVNKKKKKKHPTGAMIKKKDPFDDNSTIPPTTMEKTATTEELDYWKAQIIFAFKKCFVRMDEEKLVLKGRSKDVIGIANELQLSCLGLGSDFTKHGNRNPSNVQIAFAEFLRERLRITRVFAYDPLFTKNDEVALRLLDWEIKQVMEATREAQTEEEKKGKKIILYMPHCDRFLYNIVIEKNWENLRGVVFIANSFQRYVQNDAALLGKNSSGSGSDDDDDDFVKRITCLPGYSEVDLLSNMRGVLDENNRTVLDALLLEKAFGDVCVICVQ